MYKESIGIVGGSGSYATLDFFWKTVGVLPGRKGK